MLNQGMEIIVIVLLLPVVMNIILPLGMLSGWLMWRGIKVLIGERGPRVRSVVRYAS